MEIPERQIRAVWTASTVTVHQAYRPEIGVPAAASGRFGAGFKRDRMTWIKPSFLWMAYRSDWARAEGQETVLAVTLTREGFDWALSQAALSSYSRGLHESRDAWKRDLRRSCTRVQWDPERDLRLRPLPHRSLQLGLSGEAVRRYVDEWTVAIEDVTPLVRRVHDAVGRGDLAGAGALLPVERPYPMPAEAGERLGVADGV
ncbi:hypothetical protein SRB5_37890 [Streptomyces sp. RB5]|uniref:DUF4291 domain-containing protein n=1 Tax=Streptomyces smaragdinus TaxID=2585196 RepID=A0A7K0CJH5_9ACTN|nr:DUF4291 domain-containing protein [Streptomyces smaragdinus]MQY13639.1 hypothetical protein [Streptomyces smaragdinus]